jgi:hypothetical protein
MRPYLTTGDCAIRLGVSSEFIRGEIEDGKLQAETVTEGRKRKAIRIYPLAWKLYLGKWWPQHPCSTRNT